MAFAEHYLLQFGGDLRGDIWSCGIRFAKPLLPFDVLDGAEQEELTDDMADDIVAWMGTSGTGWPDAAKLRFVKFNRIATTGRYHDDTVTHARYFDTAPYPTGVGTSTHPNQVACVISWVTAAERGRASKGRIYVPSPPLTVANSSGMWAGGQSGVADGAAAFLDNLNNHPGLDTPGVKASVVSRIDGTVRHITGVRVGSVPDTMRSRRNALVESYMSASLP